MEPIVQNGISRLPPFGSWPEVIAIIILGLAAAIFFGIGWVLLWKEIWKQWL